MARAGSGFSRTAAAAGVGYLFGTAPSADVVARLASRGAVDIREAGTGNPGAANVVKTLGAKWGFVVWLLDVVKAVAGCRVGQRVAGGNGAHAAGVGAVVGHCYPVWTGFKGGKGVSCSIGQVAATFPAYFPVDFGVALLTWSVPWWKSRAEVATYTAAATWIGAGVVWWRKDWPNYWGPAPGPALPLAASASTAVIVKRFLDERANVDAAAAR